MVRHAARTCRSFSLAPSPRTTYLALVWGLACVSMLGLSDANAQTLPPNFAWQNIASSQSFNNPVGVAFTDNGYIMVAEKRGYVWILELAGGADPDTGWTKRVQAPPNDNIPFVDINVDVLDHHDRGMLGIATYNFSQNGHIWLAYSQETDFGDQNSEQWNYITVVRYTQSATNEYVVDYSTKVDLVGEDWPTGIVDSHFSHTTGTLMPGSDGTMLFSVGDGAHYNSGIDPGGRDAPQFGVGKSPDYLDMGAFRSLSLKAKAGKVLRFDRNTGDAIPSNPFYDALNPRSAQSLVWCKGLRNPYRCAINPLPGSTDPADANPGVLYLMDVGWGTYEELNVAFGGESFGWPCWEGLYTRTDYHNATPFTGLAEDGCPPDNSGETAPSVAWPRNDNLESVPVPGIRGNTAVGATYYNEKAFPVQFRNVVFFSDYGQSWMKVASLDGAGNVVTVTDFATSLGRPVELKTDPWSGDLIYISWTNDQIRRIKYVGPSGAGTPPTLPTGFAVSSGNQQNTLTWEFSPEADIVGYNVYRADQPGGATTLITTTPTPNSSLVDDGSVSPVINGNDYYYTIEAVDDENPQQSSGPSAEVTALPSAKAWEFYVPLGGPTLELPEAPAPFPRDLSIPNSPSVPYNHWTTTDLAPQLRRFDVPAGDFTLETRVTLTSYNNNGDWFSGLIVAFSDFDVFTFGPHRGTTIRLERGSQTNLAELDPGLTTIDLRVVKTGSDYSFEWRPDEGSGWNVLSVQSEGDAVQHVGFILKAWTSNEPATMTLEYLAINEFPPVVAGTLDLPTGATPHTIQCSSAGSYDPDGDILTYQWSFGDGGTSTEANPAYIYNTPGAYPVTLTVQDGAGIETALAVDTVTVSGNTPPTAQILSPANPGEYIDPSAAITLIGSGTDNESATNQLTFEWSVDLYEGGVLTVPDYIVPAAAAQVNIVPNTNDVGNGVYLEVTLTVTDPQLASATDTIIIDDHSLPSVAILDYQADLADGVGAPTVPGAASPWVDLEGGYHGVLADFAVPGPGSGWNGTGAAGDPYRLSFDGTDDVVIVTAGSIAPLQGVTEASVELWLKTPNDVVTRNYVFEWLSAFSAPFAGFTLAVQNGTLQVYLDPWQDVTTVAPDRWYHVVACSDPSGTRAYVDGVEVLSVATSNLGDQVSELVLGAGTYPGLGVHTDFYAGDISEVRVYDYTLTPGNVAVRYAEGLALYENPPTISGITPASGSNDGTIGVQIDGNDFAPGATVALRKSGETDIAGTTVVVAAAQITCDLDLNGAAVGDWDVVVVQPSLVEGVLTAGLSVTAPPIVVVRLLGWQADGVNPPAVPSVDSPWVDVAEGLPANLTGFAAPNGTSGWQGTGAGGDPYRLRFDGSDDCTVVAGGSIPSLSGGADVSVGIWWSPSAELQQRQVLFEWLENAAAPFVGCGLLLDGGNLLLRLDETDHTLVAAPSGFSHVVVSFSGGGVEVFVDGVSVFQLGSVTPPSQTSELVLGASPRPGGATYEDFLEGDIAVFRVHRVGLDVAAVNARYAADLPFFTPGPMAQIALNPSQPDVGLDGTFTVDLDYDDTGNGFGLRGGSFKVFYDPAALQCESTIEGALLPGAGATFFQVDDSVAGEVKIDMTVLGASAGANGAGTLASLEFSVLPAAPEGASNMSLAVNQLVDVADPPTGVPNAAAGADLNVDITAPGDASNLLADAYHEGVHLSWTAPPVDYDGVTLFYRPWDTSGDLGYPEYDDGGAAPVWPTTLQEAREPSNGWTELVMNGGLEAGDLSFAGRSVVSVLVVARDAAGNLADIAVAPRVRIPSYHLGDLGRLDGGGAYEGFYDGMVDGVNDLPVFSMTYNLTSVDPGYISFADIGPTDTLRPDGVPQTDDEVEFEDLMVFAQDFGTGVTKAASEDMILAVLGDSPGGPLRLEAGDPLAVEGDDDLLRVPLALYGETRLLKGLHLRLAYNPDEASYRGLERDDLLDLAGQPVLTFAAGDAGFVEVDLAVVGQRTTLGGQGVFAYLLFEREGVLGGTLEPVDISARDVFGKSIPLDGEGLLRESIASLPRQYVLHPAAPNPFNPRTTIAFELPQAGSVSLRVFDVSGRLIKTLVRGPLPSGYHSVVWDGTDGRNNRVASGVYLYELNAKDYRGVAKMILVK